MIGVVGGLVAALSWGCATLVGARTSRLVGARMALAWVALVGLVATLPAALATGVPAEATRTDWAWAFVAGAGAIAGLACAYGALRVGKVGVVAPIVATDGAIAAVISVVAGERLRAISLVLLAVITAGVVLAAREPAGDGRSSRRSIVLASIAACTFAVSFFGAARGADLGALWVVTCARIVGVALVTAPLLARGGMRVPRTAVPWLVLGGLLEVGGYAAFTIGAADGAAVPSVLAAEYAAIAAIGGVVLFGEKPVVFGHAIYEHAVTGGFTGNALPLRVEATDVPGADRELAAKIRAGLFLTTETFPRHELR